MSMCTEGWPAQAEQEPVLKGYRPEQATLAVKDGLLLKDIRLVIPLAMSNDVHTKLPEGEMQSRCMSNSVVAQTQPAS